MRLPSSQDYHKYCRKRGTNALCKPCKYYLNQILTYKFALLQGNFYHSCHILAQEGSNFAGILEEL